MNEQGRGPLDLDKLIEGGRLRLRAETEDASLADILDRILDKGIVLDPWVRVVLGATDLRSRNNRIVVAPERRRKPFIIPPGPRKR
ncbi:MAG TPA: gas vesicle protein GvpJ [Terriglobia bacterium]|nr:gas vesicle protein GvpJ [Terriglobia bacterium]